MVRRPSKASQFRNRIPCCLKSMKGLASSRRGNWCDCPKTRSFSWVLHWCGLRTDSAALCWLLKDAMTAQRKRRSVHFLLRSLEKVRDATMWSYAGKRQRSRVSEGPMRAMSDALSLWALPMTLGIRTSSAEASGRRGRWTRNNALYLWSNLTAAP